MTVRPRWVFVAVVAVSLLALARTQLYYGTLYHGWDAQFYYATARSIVLDGDLDLTNDLLETPAPKSFDPDNDGTFRLLERLPDGRVWSKYPVGMSLVEAPLVAAGRAIRATAGAAGVEVTGRPGYSQLELWTVAVGLVLLFAAGLTELYRLLADEFDPTAAAVGVVGGWAGTSLFFYSAVFPYMSHAVSFALLVAVMRTARDLACGAPANRGVALLGLTLGALFLVRPQQVVIVAFLLPTLLRIARDRPLRSWAPGAAVGFAAGAALVATQLAFNYSQRGVWSLNGYAAGGEGFNFARPDLSIVLFSESRGLLRFSPVVLLAAVGYAMSWRTLPVFAWATGLNLLAQIYLIASWSSPDQGISFGGRMWSDNAAAVGVGLAALMGKLPKEGRWAVAALSCAAVGWTTVLMVRYIWNG